MIDFDAFHAVIRKAQETTVSVYSTSSVEQLRGGCRLWPGGWSEAIPARPRTTAAAVAAVACSAVGGEWLRH